MPDLPALHRPVACPCDAPVFEKDCQPNVYCRVDCDDHPHHRPLRTSPPPPSSYPSPPPAAVKRVNFSGRDDVASEGTPQRERPSPLFSAMSLSHDGSSPCDMPSADRDAWSDASTQPGPAIMAQHQHQHVQMDPRGHFATPFVQAMLAAAGRPTELHAHAGARFFRTESLDAILGLKTGVYLTVFDAAGARERFFRVGNGSAHADQYGPVGGKVPILDVAARGESEIPVERLPLSDLMGVQAGAGNPAFRHHSAGQGYVKGVKASKQQRTLHPTRLCFTLWFRTGAGGFRSVDLAAVSDSIFNTCITAFHAIRCVNSESNHTLGAENAQGSSHGQTHLAKRPNSSSCPIL